MLGPLHARLAVAGRRAWEWCARRRNDRSGLLAAGLLALLAATYALVLARLPGLSLDCALHALLAWRLAQLSRRRPQWFAAHRTPLLAACCFNGVRLLLRLVFDNGWHVHPESSLAQRMGLIAAVSPAPWLAWLFFFHAPTHRSALVTLPLLTALPLYRVARLCTALLRGSPGLKDWCDGAHRALWLLHSAATLPVTPLPAAGGSDPQAQCLAVSAWALLLTGVALPLLLLQEAERRAGRQRHAAAATAAAQAAPAPRRVSTRRRASSQPSLASVPEHTTAGDRAQEPATQRSLPDPGQQAGQEAATGGGAAAEPGAAGEQNPLLVEASFLQWCLRPYLYSSLAWSAAALLLHALPMAVEGAANWPPGASQAS